MTIYRKKQARVDYRKIYEQHYGFIPIDDNGRTYEIHHIDGDHSNHNISNLEAVTIEEHYAIHESQGDWAACLLMSDRMKISPEEKSILSKKAAQVQLENGKHPWKNSEIQKENNRKAIKKLLETGRHAWLSGELQSWTQQKLVEEGKHHFLGGDFQREVQRKLVEAGTHHLLSGEIQRAYQLQQAANDTHNFSTELAQKLISEGRHPTQKQWTCESCGTAGVGASNYERNHGSNCKWKTIYLWENKKTKQIVIMTAPKLVTTFNLNRGHVYALTKAHGKSHKGWRIVKDSR